MLTSESDTADMEEDEMMDVEEMTQKARRDQGSFEMEVSYEGDAGFQKHSNDCAKNPGHQNFIFINGFSKQSLDKCYQDDDIVDLVKAQCDITVSLKTKGVSQDRPKDYPFYNLRGKMNFTRSGSGWVYDVIKGANKRLKKCKCQSCTASTQPKTVKGTILIKTAKHVVYDNTEAQNTTCYFFYDTPSTDKSTLPVFSNLTFDKSNTREDWCIVKCLTHDEDLVNKMHDMCRRYKDMCKKVRENCTADRYNRVGSETGQSPALDPTPRLAIVTSHPHGGCKRITIGEWTERRVAKFRKDWTVYAYNTPTCSGSSGALVYILGMDDERHHHPHSKTSEVDGINVSGAALDEKSNCRSVFQEIQCRGTHDMTVGDLIHLLCDEKGSRFLRRQLEKGTLDEKNNVFDAIQSSPFLMTHVHGHRVFNKMLETGSRDQIIKMADRVIGRFFDIVNDIYGSKIIEMTLACTPSDKQILKQYLEVPELQDEIARFMQDRQLAAAITSILKHGHKEDIKVIAKAAKDNMATLIKNRCGSNVMKDCLRRCTAEERREFIYEVCRMCDGDKRQPELFRWMADTCLEEVVLQINVADPDQRKMLIHAIRLHCNELREMTTGREIIHKTESSLLRDFRNKLIPDLSLCDLKEHIVEFVLDYSGSRFIQDRLKQASKQDMDLVIDEIRPEVYIVVIDEFGHSVIETLLEVDHHRSVCESDQHENKDCDSCATSLNSGNLGGIFDTSKEKCENFVSITKEQRFPFLPTSCFGSP